MEASRPPAYTVPFRGPTKVFTWSYVFIKFAKARSFCIPFDKEDPPNHEIFKLLCEKKKRNSTGARKGGRVTVNLCMFPRQGFQKKVGTFQK